MTNVVIADHHELFSLGAAEVLDAAQGFRVVGRAKSAAELIRTLEEVEAHVLILSASFLPIYPQIQRTLVERAIGLLLLADEHDQTAYEQWLGVRGIVYRSMNERAFIHAVRRVTRNNGFEDKHGSDAKDETSEVA